MWWMALAAAGNVQWRADVGGQFEQASHGIVDLGVRGDGWSMQLLTDTVDLRAHHQGSRGRMEMGARAAAFASGLWITPWTNGAPDLSRAHRVAYVGPDGRAQAFLGGGWYLEGAGSGQRHWFTAFDGVSPERPDVWWGHAEGTVGGWFDEGARWMRVSVGVDAAGPTTAPFVHGTGQWAGKGWLAPLVRMEGVVAEGADEVVATRMGGMTPYHVPFAGAGWAEFWVEDVFAMRGGLVLRRGPWSLPIAFDALAWTEPGQTDPKSGWGTMVGAAWREDAVFVDVSAGWSPTIARPDGTWPVPVYVRLGTDWR